MSLLRILGLGRDVSGRESEPESLIEMTRRLEALPPAEARMAAAFAFLMARIAGADLRADANERASMVERIEHFAGLTTERADLLVDAALEALEHHGATDNHLVARAYRDISSPEERLDLIRCLYAVAAADETITTDEDNEIFEVARVVGVSHSDVIALRSEWRSHLGTLKGLPSDR
jgi:uncharacterized tellurite resistance protein B-like protein